MVPIVISIAKKYKITVYKKIYAMEYALKPKKS